MKNYIEVKTTKKECSSIICDMCKKLFACNEWHEMPKHINGYWGNESFEIDISYLRHYQFLESGHSASLDLDICVDCWDKEFIPWLKSKGVDMTYTESSW